MTHIHTHSNILTRLMASISTFCMSQKTYNTCTTVPETLVPYYDHSPLPPLLRGAPPLLEHTSVSRGKRL